MALMLTSQWSRNLNMKEAAFCLKKTRFIYMRMGLQVTTYVPHSVYIYRDT